MLINNGIVIDGKRTLPARIKLVDYKDEFFIYNITIYEGRNREIRKMFEFINVKIYNLKRLRIGLLELGDLKEGKFRHLTEEEKLLVFMEE
jgi:23S rRNA pseudouridine2605 synthase